MSTPLQPVYILLDTSGSMRGEPIAAVNVGLAFALSEFIVAWLVAF